MRGERARALGSALLLFGCSEVLGFEDPVLASDAGGPGAMSCATHADCNEAAWNGPYMCRDGACLDLTTRSCPVVLGREHLDDGLPPVLFGAFSVTNQPQPLSNAVTLNYELAVRDFIRSGGLLVGERSALPLVVVCDGLPDTPAELDASIDHLVDTLQVPGILAAIDQAELARSFQRVFVDKGRRVLFVSANGHDSLVTTIDDEGLLWHLLPGPLDVAPAYLPLVARLEAHLNPEPPSGARPPLRLALVTSPDHRFLDDVASYLRTHLMLNGKPLLEQSGAEYLPLSLPSSRTNPPGDLSFAVETLREFKPHLILSVADPAFLTDVLPVLERNWAQISDGQPPPFYVLSPLQNSPNVVSQLLSQHLTLRTRLIGVNIAGAADPALYRLYLDRLTGEFPGATNTAGTENYYDAAYWLFYAAVASAAVPPLDGPSLAFGMTRLLSGERLDVGPTPIADASRTLRREPEASRALFGTLGPPDFDVTYGTRRGTASVWCFDGDLRVRYDTLRFDPTTQELRGSFPCFDL